MAVRIIFLAAFLAALAPLSTAQLCNYTEQRNCINADASASVSLPIPTLFSRPPTFHFATDDLSTNQSTQYVPFGYQGPVQRVAWWLTFDNSTVNYDSPQSKIYTVAVMETGLANRIGGGDGGCQDLLGMECIANLRALLVGRAVEDTTTYLSSISVAVMLKRLNTVPLKNLSCPHDIFGDVPNLDYALTGNLFMAHYRASHVLRAPLSAQHFITGIEALNETAC
ncbi:hypothetical protein K4F52_002282 [Lecanicillium sp. MT-2017a]|nr:hypothetical protein K4F52_002282 [Lecanicillium sp. MT-2017a]